MLEETSLFCSYYFETHVQTRNRRVPRNDDGGECSSFPPLSIFNYPGRHEGVSSYRVLNDEERDSIQSYVLLNCPEVDPFYDIYIASTDGITPRFQDWFRAYVMHPNNDVQDPLICSIAWGPMNRVQTFPIYFVNDYCFHTSDWARNRKTNNSGIALSGEDMVYHGILQEIIEVEYTGSPVKRITFFNCKWFDPRPNIGTRTIPKYGIVEVKSTRSYIGKDTFIFAQQAEQIYLTPYPNPSSDKRNWLSVIKTKSRRTIQSPDTPFQDDARPNISELSSLGETDVLLRDYAHEGDEVILFQDYNVRGGEEEEEEEELLSSSDDSETEEDISDNFDSNSD